MSNAIGPAVGMDDREVGRQPHSRSVPSDRALRQVLGSFTTGVTVVTFRLPDGRPLGVTANSFTSVSLQPPLVLVCLSKSGRSSRAIVDAGRFAVNILQSQQQDSAAAFSGATRAIIPDRWSWAESGLPLLAQSLATIECSVHEVMEGGDHDIIVGSVLAARSNPNLQPLVYYSGRFWSVSSASPGGLQTPA